MTGREWCFWVDGHGGKQYANKKFGGVYLKKPARDFEMRVRDMAIVRGVQLCEYAEILIIIYWPDKDDSGPVKGRCSKEIKKGRADGSNTFKSVEDALQRITVNENVRTRLIKWALQAREEFFYLKSKVVTLADEKKHARTLRLREKAALDYIAMCKRALCGAVVRNDRTNLDGHWRIMFDAPGTEPMIWVRVRETTREEHFTPRLQRWQKGETDDNNR